MLFEYLADKHSVSFATYLKLQPIIPFLFSEKLINSLLHRRIFYFTAILRHLCILLPQFRQEYLDTLYRYAKFQYECGNYSGAAEYLYFFRVLVSVLVHVSKTASVYPMFLVNLICEV